MHTKKANTADLVELLVRCRTEKNLTLEQVSDATQLTAMTLSIFERRVGKPRRTTLLKIEQFLQQNGYLKGAAA